MLRASDLSAYDLPALSAGLLALSAKRGLQHRAARRLLSGADADAGSRAGLPETREAIGALDGESALLASAAGFVETVNAFLVDENQRPPAQILRLAPRPTVREPAPKPSLRARVLAALGGRPQDDRTGADAA